MNLTERAAIVGDEIMIDITRKVESLNESLEVCHNTIIDLNARNAALRMFQGDARAALEIIEKLGGEAGEIARETLERWT